MKKILIIANLYHASPRMPGVATYLPEFGWNATIVTPPVDEIAKSKLGFPRTFLEKTSIASAPFRGDIFWLWRKVFRALGFSTKESITEQLKERAGVTSKISFFDRLMRVYQTFFAFPDTERTWRRSALRTAQNILSRDNYDAVMSSSPFPTSHIVASMVSKTYRIPWLADFRDLWTQNHNYPYGTLRKRIEQRLELRVLSTVDAMTTVTPPLAEKQRIFIRKDITVISNGFDPDNLLSAPERLSDKFTMTYTGSIYAGKQDPEKFLRVLYSLLQRELIDRSKIEVRFFGPKLNWLTNLISNYQLSDVVHCYGTVPRAEVILKQRESQVLLLFKWEDQAQKGVYFSKTYEYFSAQRPVLAVGGFRDDDIDTLYRNTAAGVCAISDEEIESSIMQWYTEFKSEGYIHYGGNPHEIAKYSYREMAKTFAAILDRIAVPSS